LEIHSLGEAKTRRFGVKKVEILYFDGCPTYKTAEKTLRRVLPEEGIDAEVELVAVNTDEEAKRLRFPGSPTIRLDGQDLFPAPEREDWRLGCRVYATPEGLRGTPTVKMLREALTREGAVDAGLHR
jgi:hypothetical protein